MTPRMSHIIEPSSQSSWVQSSHPTRAVPSAPRSLLQNMPPSMRSVPSLPGRRRPVERHVVRDRSPKLHGSENRAAGARHTHKKPPFQNRHERRRFFFGATTPPSRLPGTSSGGEQEVRLGCDGAMWDGRVWLAGSLQCVLCFGGLRVSGS